MMNSKYVDMRYISLGLSTGAIDLYADSFHIKHCVNTMPKSIYKQQKSYRIIKRQWNTFGSYFPKKSILPS